MPPLHLNGEDVTQFAFSVRDDWGVWSQADSHVVSVSLTPVNDVPTALRNPYAVEFSGAALAGHDAVTFVGMEQLRLPLDAAAASVVRGESLEAAGGADELVGFVLGCWLRCVAANCTADAAWELQSTSGAARVLRLAKVGRGTLRLTDPDAVRDGVASALSLDVNYAPASANDDAWVHVVVVQTQAHLHVLVNGQLAAVSAAAGRGASAADGNGGSAAPTARLLAGVGFAGALDEVGVWEIGGGDGIWDWTRVADSAGASVGDAAWVAFAEARAREVMTMRPSLCSPPRAGLLAYWGMDEGIGTTVACVRAGAADGPGTPVASCGTAMDGLFGDDAGSGALTYPVWHDVEAGDGGPSYAVSVGAEEGEQVVWLSGADVDSARDMRTMFVTRVPDHGKLYQYGPGGSRGALIDPYLWWLNVQAPVTQFASRSPYLAGVQDDPRANFDDTLQVSTWWSAAYALDGVQGPPTEYQPDTPNRGYGDSVNAWSPSTIGYTPGVERTCLTPPPAPTEQNPFQWSCAGETENEFMDLGFATPVYLESIALYENLSPGAVTRVRARNPDTMQWVTVYEGEPELDLPPIYRVFEPQLCKPTTFKVDVVRVEIATHLVPGWNELEAVSITGLPDLRGGIVADPLGRVIYVPDDDVAGVGVDSVSFRTNYCAYAGDAESDETTVVISVDNVNDAPVCQVTELDVIDDSSDTYRIDCVDADVADTVVLTVTQAPVRGQLVSSDGVTPLVSGGVVAGTVLTMSGVGTVKSLEFSYVPDPTLCGDEEYVLEPSDGTVAANLVRFQTSAPCVASSSDNGGTIGGIVGGVAGALVLVGAIVAYLYVRKVRSNANVDPLASCLIEYSELQMGEMLGTGASGDVYRASFRGTTVAVKTIKEALLEAASDSDGVHKVDANSMESSVAEMKSRASAMSSAERTRTPGAASIRSRLSRMRTRNPNQSSEEERAVAETVEQFLLEISTMVSLRHPNVLLFMGSVPPPNLCIVTEFMENGTLTDYLASNPNLPYRQKAMLGLDATRGMAYLHNSNPPVLHCDLKSPNLLLDHHSELLGGGGWVAVAMVACLRAG